MVICEKCGENFSDDMTFCGKCGEKIEAIVSEPAKICGKCGHQNDSGMVFCDKCGTRFESTSPSPPVAQQSNQQPLPQPSYSPPQQPVPPPQQYPPSQQYPPPQQYSQPPQQIETQQPQQNQPNAYDTPQVRGLIGKKDYYYIHKFNEISNKDSKISWNWCAFIFSGFWMLYRKLNKSYTALFFGAIIIEVGTFIGAFFTGGITLIFLAIFKIVVGLYGNVYYKKYIDKQLIASSTVTN